MEQFNGNPDIVTVFFLTDQPSTTTSSYQFLDEPMFPFVLYFCVMLFILLCYLLLIFVHRKLKSRNVVVKESTQSSVSALDSLDFDKTQKPQNAHSLFVNITNSKNPLKTKKVSLVFSFSSAQSKGDVINDNLVSKGSDLDNERGLVRGDDCEKTDGGDLVEKGKKKKKRVKKKKENKEDFDKQSYLPVFVQEKNGLDSLYPFTSSSSITQRKIKQQYDQLVKSHDSKSLTLAQVGQFAKCLVEARNDLQHKSEILQRKYTITKALLYKADRSSFDRISQQIYKLEAEQKRLDEDAVVYNRIQDQLKLSPAYKKVLFHLSLSLKMLEVGARMESDARSGQLEDNTTDSKFFDISFEEFLEQEKKDSFCLLFEVKFLTFTLPADVVSDTACCSEN
ncbi:hypothetical protein C5167_020206 [Papaver somniferum]|uniref:Uncharacterized protein n=1 Tax=Papaver somniferum TaxID=3469 RepID=A0A4Y7ISD0_PAPSO|nr:hypothetical protein C5167_020206 [Papaver somniferum]